MKDIGVLARISVGELIDKITILQIKSERITAEEKLSNINKELGILNRIRIECMKTSPELARLEAELKRANEEIWSLEDEVRDHERRKDFGTSFISVARSIYRANDERAMLKRHINNLMGSDIIEEKSYSAY